MLKNKWHFHIISVYWVRLVIGSSIYSVNSMLISSNKKKIALNDDQLRRCVPGHFGDGFVTKFEPFSFKRQLDARTHALSALSARRPTSWVLRLPTFESFRDQVADRYPINRQSLMDVLFSQSTLTKTDMVYYRQTVEKRSRKNKPHIKDDTLVLRSLLHQPSCEFIKVDWLWWTSTMKTTMTSGKLEGYQHFDWAGCGNDNLVTSLLSFQTVWSWLVTVGRRLSGLVLFIRLGNSKLDRFVQERWFDRTRDTITLERYFRLIVIATRTSVVTSSFSVRPVVKRPDSHSSAPHH